MTRKLLSALLLLLGLLGLARTALATITPPAGRPLAEALNPDGTMRAGASGSFDARAFRMQTAPDGRPVFRSLGTTGAGDARWADGFGLANGTSGTVRTVVRTGCDTYVGGRFSAIGNVAARGVARWNGTSWSSLGTGAANGTNGTVYALALDASGDVYAGGDFTQAGGVAARGVARWNGTAWSSLGAGVSISTVNVMAVYAITVAANGEVQAGGSFQAAGGISANSIAKWSGTAWSSLGTGTGSGLNGIINAVVVAGNGEVYVGGNFVQAGGITVNNLAKWNGTAWSSLGTGFDGPVYALALAGNGDLYAGGGFWNAGATTVNGIAKWNGTAWSGLGTGVHTSPLNRASAAVLALAISSSGEAYAGGVFGYAGSEASNNIAKWNGTAWSRMASGTDTFGTVYAVAIAGNGDVYVGGVLTGAGMVASKYVARWNGTAWSSLGAGNELNGSVNTLAVAGNGDVYAGGSFTQAGGTAASRIAKWNGTAWSSVGPGGSNGLDGGVYSLAVAGNGDVYAGGFFTQAGGQAANNVARWNGAVWSSLGTGLNSGVADMAISPSGKLYAVGGFTATGDGSKAMAGFGIYDPAAPLATTAAQATPAAQLFPNPAHGTATLRLPAGAPRQPVALTDALGRLVREYPASAEAQLDLRGLPAGVYVVRCGQLIQRLVVE